MRGERIEAYMLSVCFRPLTGIMVLHNVVWENVTGAFSSSFRPLAGIMVLHLV